MKVKLLLAVLYRDEELLEEALKEFIKKYGDIDMESEAFEFNFTDYYFKEMGKPLYKKLFAFENLIDASEIRNVKKLAMRVEEKFSENGKRRINIDPGYVSLENLVLTTRKKRYQRVYLGDGIFAEVTLILGKNRCKHLHWTYPDYKTEYVCRFLLSVRKKLKEQLSHDMSKTVGRNMCR